MNKYKGKQKLSIGVRMPVDLLEMAKAKYAKQNNDAFSFTISKLVIKAMEEYVKE